MEVGEIDFIDTEEDIVSTPMPGETGEGETTKQETSAPTLDDEIVDFKDLKFDGETEDADEDIVGKPSDTESHNTSTSSSPDKSLYLNLAKALSEKGIINEFEEKTFEDEEKAGTDILMELLQSTVDDSINEYKSQFSGDTINLMNAIEKGLPIDGFLKEKSKALNYSSITEDSLDDEENSGLREGLLRDFYKSTTSFSDKRIDKEIRRMVDLGDDVEESKEALTRLKTIANENAAKELKDREAAKEQQAKRFNDSMANLKSTIDDIDLSFLGGKTTKKARERYYDMLTKPVDTVNGISINAIAKKRNDIGGEKFDIILAALMDKGVFDGDMSKLSSKQRRNAIDELQRSIEENSGRLSASGRGDHNTYDDFADSIFQKKR